MVLRVFLLAYFKILVTCSMAKLLLQTKNDNMAKINQISSQVVNWVKMKL